MFSVFIRVITYQTTQNQFPTMCYSLTWSGFASMQRRWKTLCLLLGIGLLFEKAVAIHSSCDQVVSCIMDSSDQCKVSIRNATLDPLCRSSSDYGTLTTSNKENFEISLIAYVQNNTGVACGVNMTLVVRNKETTGFFVQFYIKAVKEFSKCRYIDISNTTNFRHSLMVSYACMSFLDEETEYPFTLTVTELPNHFLRRLKCRVPDRFELDPPTVDGWKSMICVELFYGMASAYVWFQTAPHRFGNLSYHVWVCRGSIIVENRTVTATEQFPRLMKIEFPNLQPGNYSIKLRPLHEYCRNNCLTTTSGPFIISEKPKEGDNFSTILTILIAVVVLLVVIVVVFLVYYFYSRTKPSIIGSTIYIVYVYNHDYHFKVVKQFATLLQSLGFTVLLDELLVLSRNPLDWIRDCVEEADFILIVWTEAAIELYNNPETEAEMVNEPKCLTSHLFNYILHHIDCRLKNSCSARNRHSPHSVYNICWVTSTKQYIPHRFSSNATFVMPNKFSRLLHHLYRYSTSRAMPCALCLPNVPGENLKTYIEGCEFLKCLKHYQSHLVGLGAPLPTGRDCVGEENENLYQPPLGHQFDDITVSNCLPIESTNNANGCIQSIKPSMSLLGSEHVETEVANECDLDTSLDDRDHEYLRSIGLA